MKSHAELHECPFAFGDWDALFDGLSARNMFCMCHIASTAIFLGRFGDAGAGIGSCRHLCFHNQFKTTKLFVNCSFICERAMFAGLQKVV